MVVTKIRSIRGSRIGQHLDCTSKKNTLRCRTGSLTVNKNLLRHNSICLSSENQGKRRWEQRVLQWVVADLCFDFLCVISCGFDIVDCHPVVFDEEAWWWPCAQVLRCTVVFIRGFCPRLGGGGLLFTTWGGRYFDLSLAKISDFVRKSTPVQPPSFCPQLILSASVSETSSSDDITRRVGGNSMSSVRDSCGLRRRQSK